MTGRADRRARTAKVVRRRLRAFNVFYDSNTSPGLEKRHSLLACLLSMCDACKPRKYPKRTLTIPERCALEDLKAQ